MQPRFRTLLLAGAALLGVSAAAMAQVTIDGSPSITSQVVKFVWNGQDISAANPVPTSTGSSSAAASGIQPTTTTTSALVAKASPGNLYGYNATAGGTAAFVAVLNATAAPAAGAAIAPIECSSVGASGTYRTRQDIGDYYPAGIVLLFTSSYTTYTAVSPAVMTAVSR